MNYCIRHNTIHLNHLWPIKKYYCYKDKLSDFNDTIAIHHNLYIDQGWKKQVLKKKKSF